MIIKTAKALNDSETTSDGDQPPSWKSCAVGDGRCRGIQIAGSDRCLRHLEPDELEAWLSRLGPGADIDIRGTIISSDPLTRVLNALHDDAGYPVVGCARFDEAEFDGDADFSKVRFCADTGFDGTRFHKAACFTDARFETATRLGPLAARRLVLSGAVFAQPVVIEAAAERVNCREARFENGVTIRLRYAVVDFERVVLRAPSVIATSRQPFSDNPRGLKTDKFAHAAAQREKLDVKRPVLLSPRAEPWVASVASLQDVDAAYLTLVSLDLEKCGFAGTRHLDQLRLEGRYRFGQPPGGFHGGLAIPPAGPIQDHFP